MQNCDTLLCLPRSPQLENRNLPRMSSSFKRVSEVACSPQIQRETQRGFQATSETFVRTLSNVLQADSFREGATSPRYVNSAELRNLPSKDMMLGSACSNFTN